MLQPDEIARAEARRHNDRLDKPGGSLGKLDELGTWIAACQGKSPPTPFTRPRLVVFAGDHGIARRDVSAHSPAATAHLAGNLLAGGAATNSLARTAGASLRVVDMAINSAGDAPHAADPSVTEFKVCQGSEPIDVQDALTEEQVRAALRAGIDVADSEVNSGADLLIAGQLGVAASTPASVLIAALTRIEPVAVVGRGSGIDDNAWMRKTAAVRDGLRRARTVASDPVALLRTAAGADLAALTGFLAQAAQRRTPVLLDGVEVGAAAMVAEELAAGARYWWLAAHHSSQPAHPAVLEHLDLEPLLELDISLGAGAGALTALPLLVMAVQTMADTAARDAS